MALVQLLQRYGALVSPRQSWHANAEMRQQLLLLRDKLEFEERNKDFEKDRITVVRRMFDEYPKLAETYGRKWLELRRKSQ